MKLEDLKIEDSTLLENVKKVIASSEDRVRTEYKKKYSDYETIKKENDDFKAEKEKATKIENAKSILKEKGLPEELAELFVNSEGEELKTSIENMAKVIQENYNSEGFKPKNTANNTAITKEQFQQMSYVDRCKLYETNPSLYNTLIN